MFAHLSMHASVWLWLCSATMSSAFGALSPIGATAPNTVAMGICCRESGRSVYTEQQRQSRGPWDKAFGPCRDDVMKHIRFAGFDDRAGCSQLILRVAL